MRFAVAAAGLAAVANAAIAPGYGPPPPPAYGGANASAVYTTEVVTQLTTYCPVPTAITHGSVTYTITEATTLTITNCPCTVTKPVYTSSSSPSAPYAPPSSFPISSSSSSSAPSAPPSSFPISPVAPVPAPYPSANTTATMVPPPATGTGGYSPPASASPIPPGYTGDANKVTFGVAGLLAAAGLVAAL